MNRFNFRQVLLVKLAVLVLGILCFPQRPVKAQEMNQYLVVLPSVGLAQGQRLRFTLFKEDGTPLRIQPMIHHTGGVQVAFGDGSVRFLHAGISESFEIKRSAIQLSGEDGTGRVQLRGSFLIGTSESALGRIAVSMETITDGTSNTVFFAETLPASPDGGADDLLLGGAARDVLMGVVPGETLKVTLINPPSAQQHIANGHIKIFDKTGFAIAQSDEVLIPSGAFHTFDFNPGEFASIGERGTGRRQVRIKPFYEFRSQRISPLVASFEIVDDRTGRTTTLVGHECLVFFLGGIPED